MIANVKSTKIKAIKDYRAAFNSEYIHTVYSALKKIEKYNTIKERIIGTIISKAK